MRGTLPEVKEPLMGAEKSFLVAVKGSGAGGISAQRLWQKRSITGAESKAFGRKYAAVVGVEVRGERVYYFWRE
jgi:hypothetical protein